jgi:glycosyltransferase involved in cell wall biosynthesis
MYKLKKSKFLILIPAYNELDNLKKFVKKVVKLAPVCILDDGSIDGTSEWLLKNKINFFKNKTNLGYEGNLINGIKKFKDKAEFLITFDGDGQHKLSDLKKIINFKNIPDIIICGRKNKNRFMEVVISSFSNLLFGLKDPLSGFKLYRTKIITKEDFKNIGQYFLVDFLLNFIKEKKIINFNIITRKRIDKSRVGESFGLSLKEFNILIKIINKKLE